MVGIENSDKAKVYSSLLIESTMFSKGSCRKGKVIEFSQIWQANFSNNGTQRSNFPIPKKQIYSIGKDILQILEENILMWRKTHGMAQVER